MTTANTSKMSSRLAGAAATLALATFGFCGAANARDNVSFSVGVGLPGVQVGNMNAYPVYNQPQPVYVQPQPVYVQPQPVYVQPAPAYAPRPVYYGQPAYYGQPVYAAPQPIYYSRPHHRRHGGYYVQAPGYGPGYRPGYAPIYYRR